jgi:hypothetical protein
MHPALLLLKLSGLLIIVEYSYGLSNGKRSVYASTGLVLQQLYCVYCETSQTQDNKCDVCVTFVHLTSKDTCQFSCQLVVIDC